MSVVILSDEIVHYEVLGRGRPLIFLHGWVGSWRYWIPTMQAASISFRTYAVDLWGFGDSARNPEYYTLEKQVELLDQFLQEMGIGKVALIGHGLGAVISLLYAYRNRRLVDRLMTISVPNGDHSIHARMMSASPEELADWLLTKASAAEAARAEAPKADVQAIQHSIASVRQLDMLQLTKQISTPCLMVYGQSDPAVAGPNLAELPAYLPENIHQMVFDQSGHFPMLDEPSKFSRLMSDFLALTSGVSPRQLQMKEEWKRRVR